MESRQPTPINGRLNQQYPPEAAVPGLAQTDLEARTRQVDTANFSNSRALAALDLMI
jgi:hypothetical protein